MNLINFTRQANYMLLGAVNAMKQDLRPGHSIQEPDYLTAIVTKFPLLMNSTWGNVKYGGCFIHKSPQVTFKKGGRCEAGDLLVLCRETVDKAVRLNATLFQLKMMDNVKYVVKKPNELIQYELYTQWPEFSIGGKFNPAFARNIEPKTVTPGAQYMLINDPEDYVHDYWCDECNLHHPSVFTHSIPRPIMTSSADLSFGRFLWDFIHWQNGRPIAADKDTANDEWSRFIWELIVKTQRVMIRNINVGIQQNNNIPKQQGDFFQLLTTKECITFLPESYLEWMADDNSNRDDKMEEGINEEENGAISILFIDKAW